MRNQDFPCLFVNLSVIRDNTRTLIALCRQHGVEPVGVNKLSCEAANVARAMIDAGISTIADSRIQNLKKIADLPVDKLLLRLPQISLAHDIVAYADISLNSEEHTLQALSAAAIAQNKTHRVILMHDLGDLALLKEKMHEADIFCDATGVGMHPLEDLSNIPDPSYFRKDLIVTDTVYAPRETVMMKQAKEAGCTRVYNGMSMMLFQALIAIELYTGKSTPVDYMKEKLGI